MQKKPAIYLVVIMPMMLCGWLAIFYALLRAYEAVNGVPISSYPDLKSSLVLVPGFFLWIPASLMI